MRELIRTGYRAVFITEHEKVWSKFEIRELQEEFPDILIFPGVELALGHKKAMHMTVLGTTDEEYVHLQTNPAAVLEKASNEGHLTVLAHPYRWEGGDEILRHGLQPDAIEYRTCNHDEKMGAKSKVSAEKLGLPLVNAGDVHALTMINKFWIATTKSIQYADEIREVILQGDYRLCAHSD